MDSQQKKLIRLEYPAEGSSGIYEVIEVNPNIFQLLSNDPFIEELSYGTILEVESHPTEKDVYTFKRIKQKSSFTCELLFLPPQLNETELRTLGNLITKEGGYWEVLFGGMVFVNLPYHSSLNIPEELNKRIAEKKNNYL